MLHTKTLFVLTIFMLPCVSAQDLTLKHTPKDLVQHQQDTQATRLGSYDISHLSLFFQFKVGTPSPEKIHEGVLIFSLDDLPYAVEQFTFSTPSEVATVRLFSTSPQHLESFYDLAEEQEATIHLSLNNEQVFSGSFWDLVVLNDDIKNDLDSWTEIKANGYVWDDNQAKAITNPCVLLCRASYRDCRHGCTHHGDCDACSYNLRDW